MGLIKTTSFELATYSQGDPQSKKLALVLPGKLDTKDYPHMRSHVDFLATQGYLALSFDPPGTWESPGDLALYTMTNYLTAINELIEHLGNKPTFVVGHSRGGSMAMLAGITNPLVTHFGAIMSYYTFKPDIHGEYPDEEWKKTGYKISRRDVPASTAMREFKLPYSFLEDQIQYDMLPGLKNTIKPKMFVVGEKDVTVKPEIVKTAYEAAAEPKVLYTLPSDHDYRFHPDLVVKVNSYLGEFLATL